MIADSRLAAVRRRAAAEDIPALVVTDIANVRYVTGFEDVFDDDANVACLVTTEVARVYTDARYGEAADAAASGTPWIVRVPPDSLYVELCSELAGDGVEKVAVESSVPYGRFRFISEQFGGQVLVVDQWIEQIRQVKEAAEIERIAAAAELTDRTFDHILTMIAPGVRESDLALEIEVFMRRNGAQGVAFPPIVASGPNSSRPHARVSTREFEAGDLLTIDMGALVDGYCSDMTRTVVVGSANDRQREIYSAVLEANLAGIAAARSGIPGMDIDSAARGVLKARGLGEYFTHGLGHGVGVQVHELPNVGPRGRDSVSPGSVLTIEPGVYVPGFGGVRIEDLVVIDDAMCRVLSRSTKELLEVHRG